MPRSHNAVAAFSLCLLVVLLLLCFIIYRIFFHEYISIIFFYTIALMKLFLLICLNEIASNCAKLQAQAYELASALVFRLYVDCQSLLAKLCLVHDAGIVISLQNRRLVS